MCECHITVFLYYLANDVMKNRAEGGWGSDIDVGVCDLTAILKAA